MKTDQQPIRIFVGCDPNNSDLEQMMVLDYSIHKHTQQPVHITWMQLSHDPSSAWYADPATGKGWHTQEWATPFSGFRWAIPEYCGFTGRAIYMDADMLVLSDINELWQHPITGSAVVAAKGHGDLTRLCTCVWDCAKARAVLPPLTELQADPDSHQQMMRLFREHPEWIEVYQDTFNCVDGEDLPIEAIKILHYSDMGTQFSHRYSLPRLQQEGQRHWFDGQILPHPRQDLAALFDQYYHEALAAGYTVEDYRVPPFGIFSKKSQKSYKGNAITRPEGKQTPSWLKRQLNKILRHG